MQHDEAIGRRVASWVAAGISIMNIASLEQMSEPTLRRLYARELELGATQANAHVAMSLYRACSTDWRAAAFWLRTRAGWVEATAPDALGKKELQTLLGKVVQQDTGWENLLQ